jgi:hypothetical protein
MINLWAKIIIELNISLHLNNFACLNSELNTYFQDYASMDEF